MNKKIIMPIALLTLISLAIFVSAVQMDKDIQGYGTIGGNYIQTTFQFEEGWNIVHGFANPSWLSEGDIQLNNIKAIYTFDRVLKEYIMFYPIPDKEKLGDARLDQIISSSPFFVYSDKSASGKYLTLEPNFELSKQLISGWNFVTIPLEFKGRSLDEVKGDCDIEKINIWDIENQQWDASLNKAMANSIGYPAIIKVANNCKLQISQGVIFETPTTPRDVEENDCKFGKGRKILNGSSPKKITFVFVPDTYLSDVLWKNDVEKFVNYLFGLEPFQQYKDRFDIWRIDDLNNSYVSGNFRIGTNLLDDERDLVINLSRDCIEKSEDLLIVIKDNSNASLDSFAFSSSMYPFFIALSRLQGSEGEVSLGKEEFAHEVGHGFGFLGDEYNGINFDQRLSWLPNVDKEGCPKWCSGALNSSSPCFERYQEFMDCLADVTNNYTSSYNQECNSFLYNPTDLDKCDLGVDCKDDTGCYWHTTSLLEFRSSSNSIMRYGDKFDGINLEIIKNRIINLTD